MGSGEATGGPSPILNSQISPDSYRGRKSRGEHQLETQDHRLPDRNLNKAVLLEVLPSYPNDVVRTHTINSIEKILVIALRKLMQLNILYFLNYRKQVGHIGLKATDKMIFRQFQFLLLHRMVPQRAHFPSDLPDRKFEIRFIHISPYNKETIMDKRIEG